MAKYKVLLPLNHNQKAYDIGATVSLDEDAAAALLAVNVVEPVVTDAAPEVK